MKCRPLEKRKGFLSWRHNSLAQLRKRQKTDGDFFELKIGIPVLLTTDLDRVPILNIFLYNYGLTNFVVVVLEFSEPSSDVAYISAVNHEKKMRKNNFAKLLRLWS